MMSVITFKHRGNFNNTERFLKRAKKKEYLKILNRYGAIGVSALAGATPTRTGKTASSWTFEVELGSSQSKITFLNTNENKGVNIAIILQYGHGTGTGGYVAGRDYINPAIQPVFDRIAEDVWKEVTA